ncbi:hypothetical protein FJ987_14245 [Mesorhizobium sp. CU2]|nr:hypothetical protein FJ988_07140 [Mesorhizobium sp. CU3]TPO14421.1 hypothetical protein FJ987_14245 [Mesorhizobium sp. CU2]
MAVRRLSPFSLDVSKRQDARQSASNTDGGHPDRVCRRSSMHSIIYIVGLVVVVLAVLSFFGLRR